MDKGKLPKSNTRGGSGAGAGAGGSESGNEAVRTRKGRRRTNIIEADPSIPDPPRNKGGRPKVGISTRGGGKGRDSVAAAERMAESIGKEPPKVEIMPFESTLAFAFRAVGGKIAAIEAARLVAETDERFKRLVYAYDNATQRDKEQFRLEDLCAAAEIPPAEFIGQTMAAFYTRNVEIGKLIAAASHSKVVEATVLHAQAPNGFMDRKMLHDHMGFLPLPKGMNINIDNSKKVLNATGATGSASVEDTSKIALPSFEQESIDGTRAIRGDAGVQDLGQKRLPAPRVEQEIIVPGDPEEPNVQPD